MINASFMIRENKCISTVVVVLNKIKYNGCPANKIVTITIAQLLFCGVVLINDV